jgi:hypothetical protein
MAKLCHYRVQQKNSTKKWQHTAIQMTSLAGVAAITVANTKGITEQDL